MTIDTTYLDSGADKIKLARPSILAMAQEINLIEGSSGSALVGYLPAGTGAVATDVQSKLRESVSVKDFGAVGDGVTDDTAAIQAANDSGATIVFSTGTYAATYLEMSTNWVMEDGAILLFVGAPNASNFINCTGNDLCGNISASGNGSYPKRLVNIEGSDNVFSRIVVSDMVSPLGAEVHTSLRVGGDRNVICEALISDMVCTGNINVSSPQGVTFGGTSDQNQVLKISSKNAQCTMLAYSPNENYVGDILAIDSRDNGIYCSYVGGHTVVNSLTYAGDDEAAVFIDGANATVGSIVVISADNTAVRINGCGIVDIGELTVRRGGVGRLFRQTTDVLAASNTLRIGRIQGEFEGGSLFQLIDGTVQNLMIGSMDVTFVFDAAVMTGSKLSWARADIVEGVCIGEANITIVDKNNVLTGADTFELRLRDPLLRPSSIGAWNVHIVGSDRVTQSLAAARVNSVGQEKLTLGAGYLQANAGKGYLREVTAGTPSNILCANAAPTVGTWKRGQVLWRGFPTALGSPGWVCTTGGTPGTWSLMPALL